MAGIEISEGKLVIHLFESDVEIDLQSLAVVGAALSAFYVMFCRKTGFLTGLKKLKFRSLNEENEEDKYVPKDIPLPVVKGFLLRLHRKLGRSLALRQLFVDLSISTAMADRFRKIILPEQPTFYPIVKHFTYTCKSKNEIHAVQNLAGYNLESLIKPSDPTESFHFNTISDYYKVYSTGSVTPLQVAENVLKSLDDHFNKGLNIIVGVKEEHKKDILSRAKESTRRWEMKKPLSVFDGIPIACKDEMYLAQYPCRDGFPMKNVKVATEDDEGWMVKKLRKGGAVFIGVSNMHQLGIGVTGINPAETHGTTRNPYNTNYPAGGSSCGSAAAVASGLCPIALGTDGGGSIRIPSAVCGIVGAKNTFTRISSTGFPPGCATVFNCGPLCATVQDICIAYGFLAGPDQNCELGLDQPPPTLSMDRLKEGITIGVHWDYFNDCNEEIRAACKNAIDYLVENFHARVIDITIGEIHQSVSAHTITILTEMYAYAQDKLDLHHDEINGDTEALLRIAKSLTSDDYFRAQQQRTRAMNIFKGIFKKVDCIITPSVGAFQPKLDEEILKYGLIDVKVTSDIMKFALLGNFTGHPSVTVPVGYGEENNLPIGLLVQTAWWEEELMYKIANALSGCISLRRPEVYFDLIKGQD